jgi:hypothetical protein
MDDDEMLRKLTEVGGFAELYRITTFKGYRTNKRGQTYEVTVELYDRGPDHQYRYHIVATDEFGHMATGNPDATINDAIAFTHWENLDKG